MCFISVLRVIEGMGELLPDFSPPIALSRVTNTCLIMIECPIKTFFVGRDVWSHIELINNKFSEMSILETIIEHNFLTPYEKILLNT